MSIEMISWVFRQDMQTVARKAVMLAYADFAGHGGETWATVDTLAAKTNLNRKTVIRTIAELEEDGFLLDSGKRAGGTARIKVYQIVTEGHDETTLDKQYQKRNDSEFGMVPKSAGNSTTFSRKQSQKVPEIVPVLGLKPLEPLVNRNRTNTPLTPQPETAGSDAEASWALSDGDEKSDPWEELPARAPEPTPAPKPSTAPKPAPAPKRTVHRQHSKLSCIKTVAANRYDLAEWFEFTFWRAYPRREAAPNAWKAIEKAFSASGMEQADFEKTVMECLGLFKASAQWQDVTKVPHPATWVNRAPWESDAPPTGQTQAAQAGQGWQAKPTQRERGEALAQHHWNKLQEELRQMGASPVGWN